MGIVHAGRTFKHIPVSGCMFIVNGQESMQVGFLHYSAGWRVLRVGAFEVGAFEVGAF